MHHHLRHVDLLELYARPRNPVNMLNQHFLQNGTRSFTRPWVFFVVYIYVRYIKK